ncbi:MAG: YkgJ family cysteine cluster protein [Deltaproteobacteria bacterium]|nr:YkgJ family cysteine cluster protein [Deltaproteobacteria bacterium]
MCCVVLRVDELDKLGGTPCPQLAETNGCSIHNTRPHICRAYRCLWLQGGLDDADRPDRLDAVIDILTEGLTTRLSIQEAAPGAFDGSARLQEIANAHRSSMPVRVVEAGNVLDPDRPFRVLLANGEEQRVLGERIELYRDGQKIGERHLPWLDRWARRLAVHFRKRRVRRILTPDSESRPFPRSGP